MWTTSATPAWIVMVATLSSSSLLTLRVLPKASVASALFPFQPQTVDQMLAHLGCSERTNHLEQAVGQRAVSIVDGEVMIEK